MLCVSPVQRFITETMQCLGFGSRARQVARGQVKKRRGTAAPLQQSIGKIIMRNAIFIPVVSISRRLLPFLDGMFSKVHSAVRNGKTFPCVHTRMKNALS